MFKKESQSNINNNKQECCYKKRQQQAAIASIFSYKHLKKVYPVGLNRSSSSLSSISSSSSLSLSLSQNSNDDSSSSLTDGPSSASPLEHKVSLALRLIAPSPRRGTPPSPPRWEESRDGGGCGEGEQRRCYWITKNSDKGYVAFHDECWGVPVYEDNQLFELLALCGMLMDYNWTEILKRKELIRKSFAGFDPNIVAKMDENEIMDIVSDKAISLAECRVRCIVDNAKCILKIVREFGSFSSYMWGHMNHKPTINKFRYPRNVPLRSPKAEAMSRELLRRGFRFVGPVIVYSFMQAAGLTIDHLVDCFRYKECVALAERPWRHM
ncbi:Probable GMP synthase [glutamine-hydrolyzing] [Linum grandiflorum]